MYTWFIFTYIALPTSDKPTKDFVYFNTFLSLASWSNGIIERKSGRDGRDGKNGEMCSSGEDRKPVVAGPSGPPGQPGPPVPSGPSGSSVSGGTVFTRWGKTTCSNTPSTEFVYEGIVGKGHHSGYGGNNYQCLPKNSDYLL